MAEGHTVHRLGDAIARDLSGREVSASASYGRLREVASLLDGHTIHDAEVHGKHLFVRTTERPIMHVHLGMDGSGVVRARRPDDAARFGRDRLRLVAGDTMCDISRPRVCAVIDARGEARLRASLGADPLRSDGDVDAAYRRFVTLPVPTGAALLDQSAIAGAGNVYRAEALHYLRLDPLAPASGTPRESFDAIWDLLVRWLPYGVASGEMLTRDELLRAWDRYRAGGGPRPHARYAAYGRAGRLCGRCGHLIATRDLLGRVLYWCPGCQTG